MLVGPHLTKLPQSWDTGSDQPSVPVISTVVFADFKFLVDGYRLSPEPACRSLNGIQPNFLFFTFKEE